jgi:hypothetical protein
MAKSTIVIRDLSTGAGISGLTVKLKKYTDTGFIDFQTAVPVTGLSGVYAFDDVPYARYKLYVNDTEDTTWDNGSDDGRFFGGRISEIVTDLDATAHKIVNLADGTASKDAVNKSQLDAMMPKAGGAFTGDVSMSGKRLKGAPAQDGNTDPADFASVGLILGVNSFVGNNYFHFPSNILIVDSSLTANTPGRKYITIQGAINYAKTKTPSAANEFNILIFPGGYTEDITLQPFIHLTGIFGKPLVTGTITGGNSNTRIRNLSFTYLGNYSLTSLRAYNSTFRVTNDDTGYILTITNCILNDCSLINVGDSEFNPTITSGGGNIFLNCLSNISCNLQSTDKGFINSLESVTTDFS